MPIKTKPKSRKSSRRSGSPTNLAGSFRLSYLTQNVSSSRMRVALT